MNNINITFTKRNEEGAAKLIKHEAAYQALYEMRSMLRQRAKYEDLTGKCPGELLDEIRDFFFRILDDHDIVELIDG